MQTGTIKNWMVDRGFGFVRPDQSGPDIFVHVKNVEGRPSELFCGDRVQFDIGTNPRSGKPEAQNVRVVEA
jgi:cold shock protein